MMGQRVSTVMGLIVATRPLIQICALAVQLRVVGQEEVLFLRLHHSSPLMSLEEKTPHILTVRSLDHRYNDVQTTEVLSVLVQGHRDHDRAVDEKTGMAVIQGAEVYIAAGVEA